MKRTVFFVLALLASPAFADDSAWVRVTESSDLTWDIQRGSHEASNTKGGVPISVAVGRTVHTKTTVISLYKWYVSDKDCDAGSGKLVTLGLDNRYQWETEFLVKSGSVASQLAQVICALRRANLEANEKKGI